MSLNNKHQQYLDAAEAQWSNAAGVMSDDFAFDANEAFAFNAEDASNENRLYATGAPANQMAEAASTIPDFNRTYTVTLTNTIAVDTPVTIFGANQFLTAVNFGLPATVTVTVGESSYSEMIQESQLSPFIISGFRVISSNAAQLAQVLTILKRDGNGQRCSYPLQLNTYFSAFQFQSGIIEVNPYNITMAGTTQISFTLLSLATVVFTFFVGKRMNIDDKLHGRPVTSVSTQKLPFVEKQQLSLSSSAANALATAGRG